MKEKTVVKRCFALVLTFVLIISGLTIPKGDVTVAEAAEEIKSATNIVGNEGANADNSEAQIGEAYFLTLANAVTAANEANGDVTIELLKNVTISDINITKKLTIAGNDHTITTTSSGQNMFKINVADIVEFKNVVLDFQSNWVAIRVETAGADVRLTNVDITSTTANVEWALINLLVSGQTLTELTLDNVHVDLDAPFRDNQGRAIIRTGNGNNNVKITATNCVLDASANLETGGNGALGRSGIVVHSTTTAEINLTDTNIYTENALPIYDQSGKATINKTRCGMSIHSQNGLVDGAGVDWTNSENAPIAQVGNTLYADLIGAVNAAKEGDTIEILRDITLGTLENSGNSNHDIASTGYISITKQITIDGNKHKVTNYAKHGFRINYAGTVAMKDMTLDCYQQQSVIQVNSQTTVNLSDIKISAKATSEGAEYYQYSLIAIPESISVSKVTLNFTRVDVEMDTPAPSSGWAGVVRTGNDSSIERTININLDGCNWDLTKGPKRKGFAICNGTTAIIDIKNSSISTNGSSSDSQIVAYGSQAPTTLTKTNSTFNNETYEAQIGSTLCTFAEAIAKAKDSSSAVTIEVLKDITINYCDIYNKNSQNMTIDGNKHTVTTVVDGDNYNTAENAWGNAFRIYGSADGYGTYELKNMKIVHAKPGVLVQVHSTGDYTSKNATVKFTNVDITTKKENTDGTVTYGGGNYGLITTLPATPLEEGGITLDFTNVNVDMEVADNALGTDEDKAIIRTGNDGEIKAVTINLTGCTFDTTKASKVSGIVVMTNTYAKINLKDSTISTKDTYAIKVKKESGLESFTMDNVKLTSNTPAYAQKPIYNSDGHEISKQSTDAFNNYRVETYKDTTYKGYGGTKYFENNGEGAPLYSNPSEIVTAGNIFGGWYADETLKTALKTSDTSSGSAVWAKLVPSHVMSVKAQISKNLIDGDDTNNSTGAIRFVTTTDSLKYQEMGFRYSVVTEDNSKTIMSGINCSDKVYEEIYALEEDGGVMNYHPSIFCTESVYFKTLIIENIPAAYFGAKITVQPFWITLDGTIVWGDEVTKTVQQGIDSTGRQVESSHASGQAFGYSQSGKIGEALNNIDSFINVNDSVKSVLVLGDLILDDFGHRNVKARLKTR